MRHSILFSAVAILMLYLLPAQAQLEEIRMLPNTPDYVDALGGGGNALQFSDGTLAIIYKIQTDYSINDEGPDRLYIVTSSDGGDTWTMPRQIDLAQFHQGIGGIATAVNSDGRAIISYFKDTGWRLLYSDDNGTTWTAAANAPDLGNGGQDIAAGPDGGFAISYLASGNNRDILWVRTSDDGLTWSAPVKAVDMSDTFLCGSTIVRTSAIDLVVIYYDCFFGAGTSRPLMQITSSDGGATWSDPAAALASLNSFGQRMDAALADDGTIWLLHTNDEDLFYTSSTDGGATWESSIRWTDNTGMGNGPGDLDQDFQPALTMFNGDPFAVFLARRGNDWFHLFYGIPGVSVDPLTTSVSNLFAKGPVITLENYPNPFSSDTRIHFELPQPGDVRLTIFNTFGQEVARPVDEKITTTSYSGSWDASGMPGGVYYVTLQTGAVTQTRSMVLAESR